MGKLKKQLIAVSLAAAATTTENSKKVRTLKNFQLESKRLSENQFK